MYLRETLRVRPSWLDWRRRNVRDTVVILGGMIGAFAFFDLGEGFQALADFAKEYADWGADDAFFLFFLLSIALVIYSLRRLQDLSSEVEGRQAAEEKARNLVATERLRNETAEGERRQIIEKKRILNELADGFEKAIGNIVETVSATSAELQAAALALANTADATQQLSAQVATAAQDASSSVQSVADATGKLGSSVAQIGRQVRKSSQISSDAVSQALKTDAGIAELSEATDKIGEVTNLITAITGQTHLLALNATIEAARAGESGRGFAIVAQEVKALSAKIAMATTEIGALVGGIQAATRDSVDAIKGIGSTIGGISEIASAITVAVEAQDVATQEIAQNVQNAAQRTSQVAINIGDVDRGATETKSASAQVLSSAMSLSHESGRLKAEVNGFLTTIRAA